MASGNRKHRSNKMRLVSDIKSKKKCLICEESDFRVLEFHHVRGTKTANVSRLVSGGYSYALIMEEIDKCIVLCSNCHKKRTWNEQNGIDSYD